MGEEVFMGEVTTTEGFTITEPILATTTITTTALGGGGVGMEDHIGKQLTIVFSSECTSIMTVTWMSVLWAW